MTDKVAIVTGGNRGIGLAICEGLGSHGARILLTGRDREAGATAEASLRARGFNADFFAADMADARSLRRLVKHVADDLGRADILVNNAGVYLDSGVAGTDVDLALVRQSMEINFYGPLQLTQMILFLMKRNNYGRIVNVSSSMASLAKMGTGSLAYRVSKTALNAMTRVLAQEVTQYNILINTASPGWVATNMGGPNAPRSPSEGADTAVWLATLPDKGMPGSHNGGFFHDRLPHEW